MARQHGAQGQVNLRVVDTVGRPVEGAQVNTAFWGSDSSANVVTSEGASDTNGLFSAAGLTVDAVNFTITKDGYYTTSGRYWFYRPSGLDRSMSWHVNTNTRELWLYHQAENKVQDGRWQPWSPTITIVLKDVRNPIPMRAKRVDSPLPLQGKPAGYDLEVGDWVIHPARGKRADILIVYEAAIESPLVFSNSLTIMAANEGDGFIRMDKDLWSSFPSAYEAPADGYQPSVALYLDRTTDRITGRMELVESEYLVFRIRTVFDSEGNVVSANYGKIYGPIDYGEEDHGRGGVRFTYYLNPTANDRNLEFDPSRNLLPGRRVSVP